MNQNSSILALDIGTVRVGVAMAGVASRIARPLMTLTQNSPEDDKIFDKICELIDQNSVELVVAGLPQNNLSKDTKQTTYVRQFVQQLSAATDAVIVFQDEGLSSMAAEDMLREKKPTYTKADIDAWSAMIILEDYLLELGETN